MIYVRIHKQTDTENQITILCPHVLCVPIYHKWNILKWNIAIEFATDKNVLYIYYRYITSKRNLSHLNKGFKSSFRLTQTLSWIKLSEILIV